MVTYRITSPRSRTDRAADVLRQALEQRSSSGLPGLRSDDAHLVDVVRLRARRVRPEIRDRIDSVLIFSGFAPLRWKEES